MLAGERQAASKLHTGIEGLSSVADANGHEAKACLKLIRPRKQKIWRMPTDEAFRRAASQGNICEVERLLKLCINIHSKDEVAHAPFYKLL